MLQKLGIARALSARPVVSLVLAVAFLALGAGFYTGRLGGGDGHAEGARGEVLVMALSCAVIGGYFLLAAVRGWRHPSPASAGKVDRRSRGGAPRDR